jgi:hypothetical protein
VGKKDRGLVVDGEVGIVEGHVALPLEPDMDDGLLFGNGSVDMLAEDLAKLRLTALPGYIMGVADLELNESKLEAYTRFAPYKIITDRFEYVYSGVFIGRVLFGE